jgi:hypothetical protein
MKKDSSCKKAIKKMVGEVFGNLTVIEYGGREKRKWGYVHFWKCKCLCGNELLVMGTSLRYGNTKSCGCLNKKKQEESAKNRYLFTYRKGAERKGRNFELTYEEFFELAFKRCHYCGRVPKRVYPTDSLRCINGRILVNGIDRVDNSKGYIKDNCVSCCEVCNLAKRNMSYNDFIEWLNNIIDFRTNNDNTTKN